MKTAWLMVAALGCAQRPVGQHVRDPFLGEPFSDEALRSACPVEVEALRAEWQHRPEGPPAVAGAHPTRVLLDVRERAADLEVAGLSIDRTTPASPSLRYRNRDDEPTTEALYAGFRGASAFPEVELWLEPGAELTLRMLLRRRVEGGLFDSLSYCFESALYGKIEGNTSYARLVVEDPGDGTKNWLTLEQY